MSVEPFNKLIGPRGLEQFSDSQQNEVEAAIIEIKRVFGGDLLKTQLGYVEPSSADHLAFLSAKISGKFHVELSSGRIVEILKFSDGTVKCIGAFTEKAEKCSNEGWAAFNPTLDGQWCQLFSSFTSEKVSEAGDWSCGWNSLQNLMYIKTGMKFTALELLHCYLARLIQTSDHLMEAVGKVNNDEELKQLMSKELGVHLLMVIKLLSEEPWLSFLSPQADELLLGSRGTTCKKDDWENVITASPEELINKIKTHPFRQQGPLIVTTEEEALLIHADEGGTLCIIDPHNIKRTANFRTQHNIREWKAQFDSFNLKTQDQLGHIQMLWGFNYSGGLQNDIDCEPTKSFIEEFRRKNILTVDIVSEQLKSLRSKMENLNEKFEMTQHNFLH